MRPRSRAYREVARLHSQLADDSARYQNEIQARLFVLFPEFVQVTARPCRPTALALLKRYPSAQAIVTAGVEALTATLRALAPRNSGGRVRRVLYLAALRSIRLPASAFGAYSRRLIGRGMKARDALMAVMRKMLIVAYPLLRSNETYDPTKVCAVACTPSSGS